MAYVRVYAHASQPPRGTQERSDFTETIYWNAGLRTDAKGKAQVEFSVSHSVTAFRVRADAYDNDGRIGMGDAKVLSVRPFYVEAKIPLEVTAGDVVELPVSLVNNTAAPLGDVRLETSTSAGITVVQPSLDGRLQGKARARKVVTLRVGDAPATADIQVNAKAGNYADGASRRVRIVPAGFPQEQYFGGTASPKRKTRITVEIPDSLVAGSMEVSAQLFPTALSNLTSALQALMREPHGCFEQTSSTNYPLVMAQQYFTTHSGIPSTVIERTQQLLDKGYKRLISFECKEKGYEWFGQDPAHEALTAYGLLELTDMARVYPVDRAMLARTRERLVAARDGEGGFKNGRRALHTWLVDPELHNGYITWALLEAGERTAIKNEAKSFLNVAAKSKNTYVRALGANVASLIGDSGSTRLLLDGLAKQQGKDGALQGATTSIVGSRGQSLQVETTSLAAIAWMRQGGYPSQVARAMNYLSKACKGGRFGSTQATVLALRAILAHEAQEASRRKRGKITLSVDGRTVGTLPFAGDTQEGLKFPDLSQYLSRGSHTLVLSMSGGYPMPFAVSVRYNARQPVSSKDVRLRLATALRHGSHESTRLGLREGDVVDVMARVENTTREPLPTPVAIIGMPGGLEPRHDQLKELKKAGRIASYEVIGRDVVLYWRELRARQRVEIPISAVAAIPGKYRGAASRAYEYYTDEHKAWVAGLEAKIAPR